MDKIILVFAFLFLNIELCAANSDCKATTKWKCKQKGGLCQPINEECGGPIWKGNQFCRKHETCECCESCSNAIKLPCKKLNGKCIGKDDSCNGIEIKHKGFCKRGNLCKCCVPACGCTSDTCTYNNQNGTCSRYPLPDTSKVNSPDCQNGCECYISDIKQTVKAAFKKTNVTFNENLRDINSCEYKLLKIEVENSVKSALRNTLHGKVVDYEVEFFRNGSTIVDGKITTTGKDSNTAKEEVDHALTKSGYSDVFVGARICVPRKDRHLVQKACAAMKNDTSQLDFICVNARDRYDCLEKLKTKEVDVFPGDAKDVYMANKHGIGVSIIATTRSEGKENEQFKYLSVAVVRKSSFKNGLKDLKGSNSCNTGYGKTAGWHVPLAKLLEKDELDPDCSKSASVVEIELSAVSSYFSKACIPGRWVPDTGIDTRLKTKYSNLCELCGNTSQCDAKDDHAGYQGALKCLVDNHGDVAWTKYDVVNPFFDNHQSVNQSEFGFLCQDGSIIDLHSAINGCYWSARPWDAWLTRSSEEDKEKIVSALINAASATVNSQSKEWKKVLLGLNEGDVIVPIQDVSPSNYLIEADFSTTFSSQACPEVADVSLCVIGDIELKKCEALAAVLQSRRVRPALTCFGPSDDCVAAVTNGEANIVSLDGGDIFKGHTAKHITPIISEVYGKHAANYFAVAAVKKSSNINKLADLREKNSCHTGIGKTAGWKIPSVTLLDAGLIHKDGCNHVGPVANFFSESCAPGAKLTKYDPEGTNPDSLCELCVGDKDSEPSNLEATKCNRDASEAFYGYTGAFRCLVEGGGDVAFIKHTTIEANTDGNSNLDWNRNLISNDYQLLCKDNTTANITDYERCHLAIVPSHKVVTGFNSTAALKEQIRILLLRASETLDEDQDVFALFGDYGSYRDIIFKSSATKLINLSDDDVNDLLSGTYYKALTTLEACDPTTQTADQMTSPKITLNNGAATASAGTEVPTNKK